MKISIGLISIGIHLIEMTSLAFCNALISLNLYLIKNSLQLIEINKYVRIQCSRKWSKFETINTISNAENW